MIIFCIHCNYFLHYFYVVNCSILYMYLYLWLFKHFIYVPFCFLAFLVCTALLLCVIKQLPTVLSTLDNEEQQRSVSSGEYDVYSCLWFPLLFLKLSVFLTSQEQFALNNSLKQIMIWLLLKGRSYTSQFSCSKNTCNTARIFIQLKHVQYCSRFSSSKDNATPFSFFSQKKHMSYCSHFLASK